MPKEVVQQTDSVPTTDAPPAKVDVSWIDSIGHATEEESVHSAPPQPHFVPVPVPMEGFSGGPRPAPVDPLVGFVKDVPGTVKALAREIADARIAEEVEPLRQAVRMIVRQTVDGAVDTAVTRARDNLRAHVARDPSVANDSVAKEVNRVYSTWIKDAANGDHTAIAALANPESPATVVDYVRRKLGRGGSVQYSGGTQEFGSTVTSSSPSGLSSEQEDLATRWGAQLGKDLRSNWAKNEADAERYLRQR